MSRKNIIPLRFSRRVKASLFWVSEGSGISASPDTDQVPATTSTGLTHPLRPLSLLPPTEKLYKLSLLACLVLH